MNHETHLVHLWLTNSEPDYLYWVGVAGEVLEAAEGTQWASQKEMAQIDLGRLLEDEVSEAVVESCQSGCLASDLLVSALGNVNWMEISALFLGDCGIQFDTASENGVE